MTKEERIQKANELMGNWRKSRQEMMDFMKDCFENGFHVGIITQEETNRYSHIVEGVPTLNFNKMEDWKRWNRHLTGEDRWAIDPDLAKHPLTVWTYEDEKEERERVLRIGQEISEKQRAEHYNKLNKVYNEFLNAEELRDYHSIKGDRGGSKHDRQVKFLEARIERVTG